MQLCCVVCVCVCIDVTHPLCQQLTSYSMLIGCHDADYVFDMVFIFYCTRTEADYKNQFIFVYVHAHMNITHRVCCIYSITKQSNF